ncbi:hypothetical protein BN1708_006357 [Verticillium longisporum]|uniref:Uncharacterized protein n=1 Tax=Verticillium longisporum TaxID=100787 RepID=A0A0G4MJR4_VERLO|nr:hypothetical protein BN1708_006357 [Verticillium longisporum]
MGTREQSLNLKSRYTPGLTARSRRWWSGVVQKSAWTGWMDVSRRTSKSEPRGAAQASLQEEGGRGGGGVRLVVQARRGGVVKDELGFVDVTSSVAGPLWHVFHSVDPYLVQSRSPPSWSTYLT